MEKFLESFRQLFSSMFTSSSVDENHINKLFLWFLILSAVIITIVLGAVITGVVRYHFSRHPGEPEQSSGNTTLEIAWTFIPLLLLTIFFSFTVKYMKEINEPAGKGEQSDLKIIAHQWWWKMQYPKLHFTTANELHVPVGNKLLAEIESADVIHDWWVPALGRKIDAIPGRSNFIWINAVKAGAYKGSCSEYCGTQHADMRILVFAQPEDEFDNWVLTQQRQAITPADSLGMKGAALFRQKTCISCHAIAGISEKGQIGPDLTHVATRTTLLSGMIPNNDQNLRGWLEDPQKIKEGAHMPDFLLTDEELKALVTYLEGLK